MLQIIMTIIVLGLIGLISWWFFAKRTTSKETAQIKGQTQVAKIKVDGGFQPEVVTLQKDLPAQLEFVRKDPSSCLEEVIFSDWGIKQYLPQDQTVTIPVDTAQAGEFEYSCGMQMFHGKIVVK